MPRIPYTEPAQVSESKRAILPAKTANVTRMMLGLSEPVLEGFAALATSFINGSPLSAQLREISILRVGYLTNSAYELFQHEPLARHVGLSDEQIAAIRTGGEALELLGPVGAAVAAFTDDIVKNVRAGDETLAAVREHLDDTQVLDLTMLVGCYIMICSFFETTGVEIDGKPIEWKGIAPTE